MIAPLFRFPLLQGNDPRAVSIAHALGLSHSTSWAGSIFARDISDFLAFLETNRRQERGAKIVLGGPRSTCRGEVVLGGPSYYPCNPNNEFIPAHAISISSTDALGLLSGIVGGIFKLASVTTALNLTDAVTWYRAQSVTHSLGLTDAVVSDLTKLVHDVIAFAQTVSVNHDAVRQLQDALSLVQSASSAGSTHVASLADAMALTQLVNLIRQLNFSHALLLVQSIQRVQEVNRADILALVEQVMAARSNPNGVVLNMSQSVGTQLTARRSFTDALGLKQGIIAVKSFNGSCEEEYTPLVPPSSRADFVLTYSSLTLTLRLPKFGNVDTVETGMVVRNTRGGEYKVVRPSSWPSIELLKFSFEALTAQQKVDLIDFVTASSGFEVGLHDQDDRHWLGVITTQVQDLVQSLRDCAWSTTLEFRGRLA